MLSKLLRLLRPARRPAPRPGVRPAPPRSVASTAPGRAHDYDGAVTLAYAPKRDGQADPGEVVWTWVPFEEDASQGKDRPVVVVGRPREGRAGREGRPADLVVLMLSSKDHAGDSRWLPIGAGAWDPEGRPSSVRLDRVLAVAPEAVRREGAALDRDRFDHVAGALLALHGW